MHWSDTIIPIIYPGTNLMSFFRLYLILAFFNLLETAEKNTANKRADMISDTATCIVYARVSDLSCVPDTALKKFEKSSDITHQWQYPQTDDGNTTCHVIVVIKHYISLASYPNNSRSHLSRAVRTPWRHNKVKQMNLLAQSGDRAETCWALAIVANWRHGEKIMTLIKKAKFITAGQVLSPRVMAVICV